jgi:hypothetical protein
MKIRKIVFSGRRLSARAFGADAFTAHARVPRLLRENQAHRQDLDL